ncbi:retroviral-like aspartic protease [Candidatus Collierbacteria bacterium]|nr:retroviral-like aspartic protease [Candidatus Collierbacteria bacterium]
MKFFPYQRNSAGDSFPIIDIFVSRANHIARIFALIDSGATVSVFKEEVAKQLGIDIEKGKIIHLGGVGGHIKGYLHELKIEVADKQFLFPVVFSREYLVSFNLLGREAVFKQFRIIFEEKKNRLKLE